MYDLHIFFIFCIVIECPNWLHTSPYMAFDYQQFFGRKSTREMYETKKIARLSFELLEKLCRLHETKKIRQKFSIALNKIA